MFNLAPSLGQARQSSILDGGYASRAIDGNTNANYSSYSVTHTAPEASPWWEVQFPDKIFIFGVVVYNRGDCCGDRILNFVLTVFDGNEVTYDSSESDPDKSKTYQAVYTFHSTSPRGVKGDRVRIRLPAGQGNRVLSLTEVEVHAVGGV